MILIVHLRLNMITLLDFSRHLGSFICMQTYFFAVLHLDEIVPVFDAGQFALDRLGAPLLLTTAVIKSNASQERALCMGLPGSELSDSRLVAMRDTALYVQEAFRGLLRKANLSDRFPLQSFGDIRENVFYCYCLTT